MTRSLLFLMSICFFQNKSFGQLPEIQKGKLIYENKLDSEEAISNWVMEGPGQVEFKNGWMEMYSPQEKYHHVFWCPVDFLGKG